MTQRLIEKIDRDRKDLLDLTLRNTLLNFRPLKTRGVVVTKPSPSDVYRVMVSDGRAMSFLPRPDGLEAPEERDRERELPVLASIDSVEPEVEEADDRRSDSELLTSHSEKRLERRLLNTYYAARTTIEELGINTLYLALGALRWFEDASSDIVRLAPLVLVPVELSRSSVRSRFRIRYADDEIGTNLSLGHKLKADFRIELPEIDSENGFEITEYFHRTAAAIADQPRWEVDREAVHLGFFSFTKLLMFEDLDPTNWFREGEEPHPVIRGLLDGSLAGDPVDPVLRDSALDQQIDIVETKHIFDADSSQAVAVADAMGGKNLVIQGPPGTGKSQTITNLIAEAIVAGKTVLFVAEKMAALEVVQRRLANADLDAACLELHSHKSSKKAVLGELEKTMRLGRPVGNQTFKQAADLRDLRDRLNDYCREAHRPIRESGVSPFKAIASTLRLRRNLEGTEPPSLSVADLGVLDEEAYRRVKNAVREMEPILRAVGRPREHPFWGSRLLAFLPRDEQRVRELAAETARHVDSVIEAGRELAAHLGLAGPSTLRGARRLLRTARRWHRAPGLQDLEVSNAAWREKAKTIGQILDLGEKAAKLREAHEETLRSDAWNEEVLELRRALGIYGSKWWRWASREFRSANRAVAGLFGVDPPRSVRARLAALDAILESRRLNARTAQLLEEVRSLIGPRWRGLDSDWTSMRAAAECLAELHSEIESGEVDPGLLPLLKRSDLTLPDPAGAITDFDRRLDGLEARVTQIVQALDIDIEGRWGDADSSAVSLTDWRRTLDDWCNQTHLLQPLASLNSSAQRLQEMGFEPLVLVALSWPAAPKHLADLLDLRRQEALLDEALSQRACLREFVAESHESALERFRALDEKLLQTNRRLVALSHYERIPRADAGGQVGTLQREFQKKRRHLPVRKLLQQAGDAIQAVKPVFMMSPLSVAAYLPPSGPKFDLVVFDEASQVRPVDAYGAILRARQGIVVGDSMQLPPTPFFDRFLEAEDEEAEEPEERTSDLESVLGLFVSQQARQRMLSWHYRSRHDDLIAVSNREFYDDRLIVFPTPDRESRETGLFFHHLGDAYYKSGRAGGYNPREAETVAGAVMEHAAHSPHLTLGVAAFSHRQAQEVRDRLEILRRGSPTLESFFADHPQEPFFIKNLENVQGDERDVIFISIGYGRREDGYLSHNFGPLNLDGGERRLNVLISRARRRCEVFSNIRGDDLDLRKSQTWGVRALKTFLQFAETHKLETDSLEGRSPDSEFETEVAERLRRHGWEVDPQVGSCGFFVDIGVRDPEAPGRYILGIECDGASYHSSAWARDRDRLRQAALENQGWILHRIWSTDWFRNEETQIRKILGRIEWARKQPRSPGGSTASSPPRDRNGGGSVPRTEPAGEADRLSGIPYQEADLSIRLRGKQLHEVPAETMAKWVVQVVRAESPVHFDEVAWRITTAAGLGKAGSRIRPAVELGLEAAVSQGRVRKEASFLWTPGPKRVKVRDRSELPQARRKIELVSVDEIGAALVRVVEASFSIAREECIQLAARMLGYARTGHQVSERIEMVLDGLLSSKRLTEHEGQLSLNGG